jgi:hypothetical protein
MFRKLTACSGKVVTFLKQLGIKDEFLAHRVFAGE